MSVKRNLLALGGSAVLARLGYFVAVSVTGRRVGVADFGRFTFVLSIFLAFSLIANFGLESLAVRTSARSQRDLGAFLGAARRLREFALPAAVVIAAALIARDPDSAPLIVALAGYGLANASVQFDVAIFRGIEHMELQTFVLGSQAALTASIVVAATAFRPTAEVAAVSYLVAAGAAAVLATSLRRRKGHRSTATSVDAVRRLARQAVPFAAAMLGFMLFDRSVIVVLALVDSDEAVGWFGAAFVMVLTLASIPLVVTNAVFPNIARAAVEADSARLRRSVVGLLAVVATLGCVVAVVIRALAASLVEVVYGSEYEPSGDILRSLSLAIPLLFAVTSLRLVAQAIDAQRAGAVAFGVGLAAGVPPMVLIVAGGGMDRAALGYTVPAATIAAALLIAVVQRLNHPHRPPARVVS